MAILMQITDDAQTGGDTSFVSSHPQDLDIVGSSKNDKLTGGLGDDILDGGAGRDTLTGGLGADTFVFHAQTAYTNPDTITDFNVAQGDKLDLSDMLTAYDPLTEALSSFVHLTVKGQNTVVSVDADGTGHHSSFQTVVTLDGVHNLADVATLVATGHLIV